MKNIVSRWIGTVAFAGLALAAAASASAQLAPPQSLAPLPIIMDDSWDFEAMAKKGTKIEASSVEVRGGNPVGINFQLLQKVSVRPTTWRPLPGMPIYLSIAGSPHQETGFVSGQYLATITTNGQGRGAYVLQTRRVTKVRKVTVRMKFNETGSFYGCVKSITVTIRP